MEYVSRVNVARLTLVLLVVTVTMSSCTGKPQERFAGECQPEAQLVGVGESAAGLAWICASFIEVDGVAYILAGCAPVDASFLGPIEARSQNYVARSIERAPRKMALAILDLRSTAGRRCGGWQLREGPNRTAADQAAVEKLACRVRPVEIPVRPAWCQPL